MTYYIIILAVGLILLFANLALIPASLRRKQYGWVSLHIAVAAIVFISIMSHYADYKKYSTELSELESQRQMVRMVITGSWINDETKERITEVWMDNFEVPYVCSMMTAFGSYKDERSANWIDVECLNAVTNEQIPYMTKENLFPKGTEFDYDIGPALDNFLHGQKT